MYPKLGKGFTTETTECAESSSSEFSVRSVVNSSFKLKDAICEVTAKRCAEEFGGRLRSVVLTGSLARDEATVVHEGEHRELLGDAEFLLVFDQDRLLPSSPGIQRLEQQIEHHLLEGGLSGHVELSPVHTRYLRTMPREIFAYELRTCGQVVWGDGDILALVPRFSPEDISREDAWRLLSNRMIELLEVALLENMGQVTEDREERRGASAVLPSTVPSSLPYSAVKLYLDMATSFLLFEGAYEPTYRGREARLRSLAESATDQDGYPFFPLRRFSERVTACTEFKLGTAGLNEPNANLGARASRPLDTDRTCTGAVFWEEISADARTLWRWELARLTSYRGTACRTLSGNLVGPEETGTARPAPTDRELMKQWMRLQPASKRLRGLASALRRGGWRRSWRQWPHWVRLGWRASPRYWVYAVACELFFRLPDLLCGKESSAEAESELRRLRSWLPAVRDLPENDGNLSWRVVAADIAWNYHEFLKGTRA